MEDVRQAWGYSKEDKVVVYFGAPAALRGLPTLLEAFNLAHRSDDSLKLLVLSRKRGRESDIQHCNGACRINSKVAPTVRIMERLLSSHELAVSVAACDVIALPFELVPSDAPLSLLEARALEIPLVTTNVACLPEMAGENAYIVQPANPVALAQALLQASSRHGPISEGDALKNNICSISTWEQVGKAWSQLVQSL